MTLPEKIVNRLVEESYLVGRLDSDTFTKVFDKDSDLTGALAELRDKVCFVLANQGWTGIIEDDYEVDLDYQSAFDLKDGSMYTMTVEARLNELGGVNLTTGDIGIDFDPVAAEGAVPQDIQLELWDKAENLIRKMRMLLPARSEVVPYDPFDL